MLIESSETGGVRNFPARIDANRKAELAFRVPGKVQELLVKEGDQVTEGQEVAKLDPKDFQIVVNDRQASFDNARKNYIRAQELIKEGNISKVDHDKLEANFKSARAALEAARQDLEYTSLKAPFTGSIARRHIQRFEEVQAKQSVLSLQNVTELEVKFNVPESIIRGIRTDATGRGKQRDQIKIFVTFVDLPGREFPLTFKEIATRADAKTQTFEVTYTMEKLDNATVLPGMTATVTVDLSLIQDKEAQVFTVPVSAVVGDYKLDPRIWTVDRESMTVNPQAVKVGRMLGNRIEVLEGIKVGNHIVTAGTPFLVEGMKVTLLPELEQAAPRLDDPKQ
ncbi:MAG: efflux RND transporter periplasmic adaptor subunit [Gammaproteobacteria bacterium]|nr:efflux RND transporter periplasmic adaptor subunit [Gammaproteobacteria bacterium]